MGLEPEEHLVWTRRLGEYLVEQAGMEQKHNRQIGTQQEQEHRAELRLEQPGMEAEQQVWTQREQVHPL